MLARAVLVAVLSVAFVFTSPLHATAATVSVVSVSPGVYGEGTSFTARPGEANDVTVRHEGVGPDQRAAVIQDSGATLEVGTGCTSLDPHTVWCATRGLVAWFRLGDGDDRLRGVQPYSVFAVVADGGPGDDVLDLRSDPSVLRGYAGTLDGGGGRDELYGGPFSDYLTDGDRDGARGSAAPGPDVLDGGASYGGSLDSTTADVVSYEQRTAPVRVDLARHLPAGETGEGDMIRRVESVYGGAGADHLAGTSESNFLGGGRGHDTLIGRGGDDTFGSPPSLGGLGLEAPVRAAGAARGDTISCGSGRDAIYRPGNGQYVRPECEALLVPRTPGTEFATYVSAQPALRDRHLVYTVGCPLAEESAARCSGAVTIREAARPRRLLATGTVPPIYGETTTVVRLRLTPTGRWLDARRRDVVATIRLQGHHLPRVWWRVRLRFLR